MKLLDLTLATPAENLALDEALLLEAEEQCTCALNSLTGCPAEVLRFWESPSYFVVLGAGSRLAQEALLDACQRDNVPVLRRDSGGGTVLQGPGCLNFSLILDTRTRPECADIASTNQYVLSRILSQILLLWPTAQWKGTSDLTFGDRKFCGTAQRRKRCHILFHGCLLYNFDTERLSRYLKHPPKEPEYRGHRPHQKFVTNFPASASQLRSLIANAWGADDIVWSYPQARVAHLVATKYAIPQWNEKF